MHVKTSQTFAGNRADLVEYGLQNSPNFPFASSSSSNFKNSCKIGHKVYIKYASVRDWHSCIKVSSKPSGVHCLKCNFKLALLLSYSKR